LQEDEGEIRMEKVSFLVFWFFLVFAMPQVTAEQAVWSPALLGMWHWHLLAQTHICAPYTLMRKGVRAAGSANRTGNHISAVPNLP